MPGRSPWKNRRLQLARGGKFHVPGLCRRPWSRCILLFPLRDKLLDYIVSLFIAQGSVLVCVQPYNIRFRLCALCNCAIVHYFNCASRFVLLCGCAAVRLCGCAAVRRCECAAVRLCLRGIDPRSYVRVCCSQGYLRVVSARSMPRILLPSRRAAAAVRTRTTPSRSVAPCVYHQPHLFSQSTALPPPILSSCLSSCHPTTSLTPSCSSHDSWWPSCHCGCWVCHE
jgi:hypothetical protein